MKTLRLTALSGISAAVLLASASMAPAFAHSGGSPATYTVSQQRVKLSPIVVDGQRMVLPVFLQIVRTALRRPWSSARADTNKLVCRFQTMLGSHLQDLSCMTNGQHYAQREATQLALFAASDRPGRSNLYYALSNGQIPVSIANYTSQHRVNRGALLELMKKLPPRGSSYTLRITDHGKALVDYVVKDGELTNIRRYTYKTKGSN